MRPRGRRPRARRRFPDNLETVAEEVRALGRTATTVPTDVTVAADVTALAEASIQAHGKVDVLVNNAFVQPPLEDLTAPRPTPGARPSR